jgi:hypothetical protein
MAWWIGVRQGERERDWALAVAERSNFALVVEAVLAGCSRLIVTDVALAMFESEAAAVHLEDMNVMG